MSKQKDNVSFSFRPLRKYRRPVSEVQRIETLFNRYSDENGVMTVSHLLRFLVEVQGEENTTEEAQAIIDVHKHRRCFKSERGLKLHSFLNYLFSDTNLPLSPFLEIAQDMSFPMSHYFIYTSHNSYLTGNQISSKSSDEPIINALRRGVRVIELDLWPNASKDDVIVLHGGNMTSPVALIKCLRSINQNAFVASEYPVVMKLEDHLYPNLWAKVAVMLAHTFGDKLFYPSHENLKEFPSPESLKSRIIISTKQYLHAYKEVQEKEEESERGKLIDDEEESNFVVQNIADEDDIIQIEELQYESLIVIHDGKPKGGLKNCLKVDHNKVKCLSLSELELAMAVATLGKEIVRFTLQNLLRVYPKGSLINSSNYNPLIGWIHGAQMVAFNMQGYGKYLWLMHGMFKANGGCGYVKKPDFLLRVGPDNKIFDPKAILPVKTTLKVTIYMGEGWFHDFGHMHFDHSLPSFLTKVAIAGVPNDIATKRTKVVDKNWSPSWNEVFEFPLAVPELALLYVRVREHAMYEMDEFCGQTCLPVWELRSGIRAVPLYSRIGDRYYHVKLLMRFEFI